MEKDTKTDDGLGEYANKINACHMAVEASNDLCLKQGQQSIEKAIECGKALVAAKAKINEHGEWLPWLKKHCPSITERTCQNYMRLANTKGISYFECETLTQAYALLKRHRTKKKKSPISPEELYPIKGKVSSLLKEMEDESSIDEKGVLEEIKPIVIWYQDRTPQEFNNELIAALNPVVDFYNKVIYKDAMKTFAKKQEENGAMVEH